MTRSVLLGAGTRDGEQARRVELIERLRQHVMARPRFLNPRLPGNVM
jgi:hypothetical protein